MLQKYRFLEKVIGSFNHGLEALFPQFKLISILCGEMKVPNGGLASAYR